MGIPAVFTLAPATADDDGISVSQTPLAAGNLTITGALASGGVASLCTLAAPAERQVLITQAAGEGGKSITLYGTALGGGQTIAGAPKTEVVSLGAGAGTVVSVAGFSTITRAAISAAASGAIKIGTNGVAFTPWQSLSTFFGPVDVGIAVAITGTINYTVQYTYDPFWDLAAELVQTFNLPALTGKTTTADAPVSGLTVTGVRLQINSFSASATAKLTVIQAGVHN